LMGTYVLKRGTVDANLSLQAGGKLGRGLGFRVQGLGFRV